MRVASGLDAWCLGRGAIPLPGQKRLVCGSARSHGSIGPIPQPPASPRPFRHRQAGAHRKPTWAPAPFSIQLWLAVGAGPAQGGPGPGLDELVSACDQETWVAVVRAGDRMARLLLSASAVEGLQGLVLLNRTVARRRPLAADLPGSCRCQLPAPLSDLRHCLSTCSARCSPAPAAEQPIIDQARLAVAQPGLLADAWSTSAFPATSARGQRSCRAWSLF